MKIPATTCLFLSALSASSLVWGATSTNLPPAIPPLPDASASLLRVFGSLALVLALFLGGVWLAKHGQLTFAPKTSSAKLLIVETKPIGARQSLMVVGYEHQRFLVAASPSGITLISTLPPANPSDPIPIPPKPFFAEALQHVLSRKN